MATKIVTKNSSTASAVPTASDLVQGELAVNVADKRLFTEDNAGAIVELGTNPTTLNVNGTATMDGLTVNSGAVNTVATFESTDSTVVIPLIDSVGSTQIRSIDGSFAIRTGGDGGSNANTVERMRIDASGNVGIGVTPEAWTYFSPIQAKRSSFAGSDGQTGVGYNWYFDGAYKYIANDYALAYQQNATSGVHSWSTAASGTADASISWSEAMRIDSSGNVGIGTSSPWETVSIPFGEKLSFGSSAYPFSISRSSAGELVTTFEDGYDVSNARIDFKMRGGAVTPLSILGSGNVGIGTSSPSASKFSSTPDGVLNVSGNKPVVYLTEEDETDSNVWMGLSNEVGIIGNTGDGIAFRTGASTATERMRISSAGNLLVGTTTANAATTASASDLGSNLSPDGPISIASYQTAGLIANRLSTDGAIIDLRRNGSTVGSIGTNVGRLSIGSGDTGVIFAGDIDAIYPANGLSARDNAIDIGSSGARFKDLYLSGGVISQLSVTSETEIASYNNNNSTGAKYKISFKQNGTQVGVIEVGTSSTSYATSSDYRLKENVVGMSGATERLKQLKPSRFNFIADADTTVDGFLAHEVQDIVPEAISGTKDAMRDEEYEVTPAVLDDDGNVTTEAVMGTRSVPDYQGIDQSKLVPLLVATIQELEARITQLENN